MSNEKGNVTYFDSFMMESTVLKPQRIHGFVKPSLFFHESAFTRSTCLHVYLDFICLFIFWHGSHGYYVVRLSVLWLEDRSPLLKMGMDIILVGLNLCSLLRKHFLFASWPHDCFLNLKWGKSNLSLWVPELELTVFCGKLKNSQDAQTSIPLTKLTAAPAGA